MVSIKNEQEQQRVSDGMPSDFPRDYWIGFHDSDDDDVWEWSDGSEKKWKKPPVKPDWGLPWLVAWVNWNPGEPNNSGPKCARGRKDVDNKWMDDDKCNSAKGYVCKMKGMNAIIFVFSNIRLNKAR